MSRHRYSDADRAAIYRVMRERRDMRHFLPDPIETAVLERLLTAAHLAPSVGLMQPWRFIRITDRDLRARIYEIVETERQETARALGRRKNEFLRLKVEGVRECAVLMVVALMAGREPYVFGRRTLPEMDLASAACAIQNLWLAARAEGLGVGWVSLFDPTALAALLGVPPGAQPIAILCLGHVREFYPRPMLEEYGWAACRRLSELISENGWPMYSVGDAESAG